LPRSAPALLAVLATACTATAPDATLDQAPESLDTIGAPVQPGADVLPGQFVLKLAPGVTGLADTGQLLTTSPELDAALARAGVAQARRAFPRQRFAQPAATATRAHATWTFESTRGLAAIQAELAEHPQIDWVEPLVRVRAAALPNDPYFAYQWHMSTIGVTTAHDTTRGAQTVVAVVDSGVSPGPDGIGSVIDGYDFFDDDSDARDSDADRTSSGSHGTHVAGTISQTTDNGEGVIGVAPDTAIMPVRVLGLDSDGNVTGTSVQVANGITWAVDNGADVINLSLGSNSYSRTIEEACEYAWSSGVLVVAAAGNDGFDGTVSYPGALDSTIAVAASDLVGERSYYSNAGVEIDLAGPGGDLTADLDGDGYSDGVLQETRYRGGWGYYFFQGTSMATPHVAGAAALVRAAQPGLTVEELRDVLLDSAFDVHGDGWDSETGHGILDVDAAMTLASTGGSSPDAPSALSLDEVSIRDIGQGRRLVTWQTSEPASTLLTFPNGNKRGDQTLVTAHHTIASGKSGKTLTYTITSTTGTGKTASEALSISF
jgi:subtilisin family serine protease